MYECERWVFRPISEAFEKSASSYVCSIISLTSDEAAFFTDLNSIARLKVSTFWPILKTFTYDLWCGWQGVHLKKMLDILLCTYFSAPAGIRKTVHIGEEFQFSVRHRKIIDCSSLYIALCLHSCSSSVDLLRFRCWSCDPRPRTRTPLPRLGGGAYGSHVCLSLLMDLAWMTFFSVI